MDFLHILLALLFFGIHVGLKWRDYRDTVAAVDFNAYVEVHPARIAVAFLSAFGIFVLMSALNMMNPAVAAASGYMGNSIIDNLAKRLKL